MRDSTIDLINEAIKVLNDFTAYHPLTLRQLYYQLVSRQILENTTPAYHRIGGALVKARQRGWVPWVVIEDRLRRPRQVAMWDSVQDFAEIAAKSYRRNIWSEQPCYVEVWLEKEALAGIFEDALRDYRVTLNVGRGYDGWSSLHRGAVRFAEHDHKQSPARVLYFGDFDPSGEDMVRSLKERLKFFDCLPIVKKVALTREDIDRYNLPPNPAKMSDPRGAAFYAEHGNMTVELDALPPDVLVERLKEAVEEPLDLAALQATKSTESTERQGIREALQGIQG